MNRPGPRIGRERYMYLWPLPTMRIRVSFRFRLRSAMARTQPKTYIGRGFRRSNLFPKDRRVERTLSPDQFAAYILERSILYSAAGNTYLIADAYRGKEIKQAITDFFQSSTGSQQKTPIALMGPNGKPIQLNPSPELSVYVGHDGLMDFSIEQSFRGDLNSNREAVILACASKAFFGPNLRPTRAHPLIWTTGLMAPEAYTLKAALDGWMVGESGEQIRQRAAKIYAQYQKISLISAQRLFSSGW